MRPLAAIYEWNVKCYGRGVVMDNGSSGRLVNHEEGRGRGSRISRTAAGPSRGGVSASGPAAAASARSSARSAGRRPSASARPSARSSARRRGGYRAAGRRLAGRGGRPCRGLACRPAEGAGVGSGNDAADADSGGEARRGECSRATATAWRARTRRSECREVAYFIARAAPRPAGAPCKRRAAKRPGILLLKRRGCPQGVPHQSGGGGRQGLGPARGGEVRGRLRGSIRGVARAVREEHGPRDLRPARAGDRRWGDVPAEAAVAVPRRREAA